MIKSLVITEMIDFHKKLTNELRKNNLNIIAFALSSSKEETLEILKEFKPDMIFINKKDLKTYSLDVLEDYSNIIIPLTYSPSSHLITRKDLDLINSIITKNDIERIKLRVIQELEYIGYQFKYKGTHYLADSIIEMYLQRDTMIDNLQTDIYPVIAKKYNKSLYNIKSSIGKATNAMYCDCNMDRLNDYFQFNYDFKPTPKQVLFTVINKIIRKN